eukprot:761252-Hanusia_phi.AAC.5
MGTTWRGAVRLVRVHRSLKLTLDEGCRKKTGGAVIQVGQVVACLQASNAYFDQIPPADCTEGEKGTVAKLGIYLIGIGKHANTVDFVQFRQQRSSGKLRLLQLELQTNLHAIVYYPSNSW